MSSPFIDITPIINTLTSMLPAILTLVITIQIFKLVFQMIGGLGRRTRRSTSSIEGG
jgi:hypothetical protein